MVDRRLPADRGIDLGEQGRGHLEVTHATLVTGCGEARDVADHPPAERYERTLPIETPREQRGDDAPHGLQGLVLLAVGEDYGGGVVVRKRPHLAGEVQGSYGLIGHHHDVPPCHSFVKPPFFS